jgi:hypothetical protein
MQQDDYAMRQEQAKRAERGMWLSGWSAPWEYRTVYQAAAPGAAFGREKKELASCETMIA